MIEIEPVAGWKGRALHSERLTLVHYEVVAGALDVHEHHHPEEETWSILEGEVAVWIGGVECRLGPGAVAVIPPNVPHRLRALTASRALVTDSPVRRDLPGTGHQLPDGRRDSDGRTAGRIPGMKVSVSLPPEDVRFLDEYVRRYDRSRSAAVHEAIVALRAGTLADAYEQAWSERDADGKVKQRDQASGDGP